MLQHERRIYIIDELEKYQKIYITDISKKLNVTTETIRRDLKYLEKKNMLKRVHGGAIIVNDSSKYLNYEKRLKLNENEKNAIAIILKDLIPNNSSIICDGSSTTNIAINLLIKFIDIPLIITNSIHLLQTISKFTGTVISTGGIMSKNGASFIGTPAIDTLSHFRTDYFITSCMGISIDFGLSDSSIEETTLKKAMSKQAKKTILLVDNTKFNKDSTSQIFPIDNVDIIITDSKPSQDWIEYCNEKKISLYYGQ